MSDDFKVLVTGLNDVQDVSQSGDRNFSFLVRFYCFNFQAPYPAALQEHCRVYVPWSSTPLAMNNAIEAAIINHCNNIMPPETWQHDGLLPVDILTVVSIEKK